MNNTYLIGLFFVALASSSYAQDCAAIESDLDRLACYDKESGRTPEITAITTEAQWDVRTSKSEMTDQIDEYISTQSISGPVCNSIIKPTLWVRCLEGVTSIFINHGCYMPPDSNTNKVKVEYRVDSEQSDIWYLRTSSDDNAFGWWDANRNAFRNSTRVLFRANQITIRFTPYRKPSQTVKFNVAGLMEIMEQTSSSCRWSERWPEHFE